MLDFFWQLPQQPPISQAEVNSGAARREIQDHHARLRDLEQQLERVTLVSQALWELLRDRSGITEDQLVDKITEVDLRDGTKDNRLSPRVVACPKCERNITTRHQRCIYCGSAVTKEHIYQ
ncbi:MAG: hypothetical protein K8T89_14065 [Planctomycetes bacterium]|nr:hypothetical protein [Planctomycetota bacterium]